MTDRFCNGAKPQSPGGRTGYFDTTCKGLELLAADKAKTWYFCYVAPSGKNARVKLGTYPSTSLAVARGLAVEARGHVEAGKDPRHVFAGRQAQEMTVAAAHDVADPDTKAGLMAVAKVIDRHIESGVDKMRRNLIVSKFNFRQIFQFPNISGTGRLNTLLLAVEYCPVNEVF